MSRRRLGTAIVAAAAALACGCVTLTPPRITVVAVRLDRLEQAQAYFGVGVELANPNAREIEITALDAAVSIEDQRVAVARLAQPVRVPAGGTASAELTASTGMDAILRATITAIMRGAASAPGRAPTLRYSVEGTAVVAGGLEVPFARSGELGARAAGGGV